MTKLYNLARMTTATTGTGTITLGSAVNGCLTFAQAGVANGETVSYAIRDGVNSEVGRGVYTSSGTTLTRSVILSTNSNTAISLSGSAEVFITALKEDVEAGDLYAYVRLTADYALANNLDLQPAFNNSANGAVTIETGIYVFEEFLALDSMSASNNGIGVGFAGTATYTQSWNAIGQKGPTFGATGSSSYATWHNTAANANLFGYNATTTAAARIWGTFNVTAGGTLIPQVQQANFSATPNVKAGSYFILRRLGATSSLGSWS